ncbi:tyrosine-type recombinase/integrase [Pseudomonas sp. URMO17WK12:I11]|uniref:tyrosine-type recombinase/integrase n=1 Tax=Pseudomonas sp. URMO17WK12:I11 TaxID=1283291 RepID=UPI000720897C|nr:tyrosine-type recombinase/integrase [Pseudomonas sp. URMO17WK12:I11]CRL48347.1 site-specific tyrosine recombinase XerC [Pseudomonas sp. URMO17WK12:I11]
MADNLEQQGGTWHVRKAIPKDVRKAFGGRKILSKSLETGLRSEAMKRRLPYLTQWTAEIAAARAQAQRPKEDWRPDFTSKSMELNSYADSKLLEYARNPPADFTGWIDNFNYEFEHIRSTAINRLTTEHDLTPVEIAEAATLAKNPAIYKPKSPITTARLEAFRAYRKARDISAKNIDAQESKLEKFSAFLATTGKPLDFDCVSAWIDSITATSKTKQQYLNAGNTFWKWAMKYDTRWMEDYKGTITPFERHDLPQLKGKAKRDVQRIDFELSEISTLHAAAHDKKLHVLADLILLGAYSGGRIEELCQLRIGNVVDEDGVQSFDIEDSKTVAGIRVVPVHPALKALVKRLVDNSKDGYLVPSDSKNKYGIRSDLMSKAFGRLKTSLGFGQFQVFHSIRKTVTTQLAKAGVAYPIIAELIGHETGTVTFDVYSQGHSAAQKLEAISKLPTLTTE